MDTAIAVYLGSSFKNTLRSLAPITRDFLARCDGYGQASGNVVSWIIVGADKTTTKTAPSTAKAKKKTAQDKKPKDLNIVISQQEDVLVVDSRLVAERLGIEHDNFIQTITKHKTKTEQVFGVVLFETEKHPKGSKGGRPQEYALLTEDQATFLMTLSTNTPEVVDCKIALVKSFSLAKQKIKDDEVSAAEWKAIKAVKKVKEQDCRRPSSDRQR